MNRPETAEGDLAELRESVERTVTRSRKLREMAGRAGYTPEDVASEALARYLKAGAHDVTNPEGWMVRAARNFIYDLHKKGVPRENPTEPGSLAFDRARDSDPPPVDESLDRNYESELFDAALRRLDERDRKAIVAFESAGSMRAVEKAYGIPKSSVQRAFQRFLDEISLERGADAARRARSRALAFHLGLLSRAQSKEMKDRLKWDTALLMEVRAVRDGGRRALALFPAPVAVKAVPEGSGRLASLIERGRDGLHWVASRFGGHESEAAGLATGGSVATKAVVAVCIGGSAAGGVCVQQGIVGLPGADGSDGGQEKTVEEAETPTETPAAPTPGPAPITAEPSQQAQTAAPAPAPKPTPVQEVQNEVGFEPAPAAPSPSASSGSEFGGGGGSSGGGSSSGGGGGEFGGP